VLLKEDKNSDNNELELVWTGNRIRCAYWASSQAIAESEQTREQLKENETEYTTAQFLLDRHHHCHLRLTPITMVRVGLLCHGGLVLLSKTEDRYNPRRLKKKHHERLHETLLTALGWSLVLVLVRITAPGHIHASR
jgi:hypothetical protein